MLPGGAVSPPSHCTNPLLARQGRQMDRRRRRGVWASGRHRRACRCLRDKASETKARPTPVAPGRAAAFLCRSGCSCQLSRASSYRDQTAASACRAQRWKGRSREGWRWAWKGVGAGKGEAPDGGAQGLGEFRQVRDGEQGRRGLTRGGGWG